MIARRFGYSALALALPSCASPALPSEARGLPSAPPASATARAPDPAPRIAPALPLELSVAHSPGLPLPTPRIEVRRPTYGELIPAFEARSYQVSLDVSAFVVTHRGQGVWLSLDGRRPRRWSADKPLRLSDLLPEDESIGPGAHVLLGVLTDAEGRVLRGTGSDGRTPFFVLDFLVGERQALPHPESPRLFCLAPVGTFYGKEADSLRVELFTTGAAGAQARLHVESLESPSSFTASVDPGRPYSLTGLAPPADVRVSAELPNGARAQCEATLNPALILRNR